MSFSADVKQELLTIVPDARHCQLAELAAFVRMLGIRAEEDALSGGLLSFRSDSRPATEKLFTLIRKAFNIEVLRDSGQDGSTRGGRIAVVPDRRKSEAIRHATESETVLLSDCCKRAFLRGAFLSGGSISSPDKYYHLEIVCTREEDAALIRKTMRFFQLEPKVTKRKGDSVVYLKEGEQIITMLGEMGASRSFLKLENIRVLKEISGSVNRKVNCETANLNKTITSAVRQLQDIRFIKEHGGFMTLTPQLREMAEVRLAYPDATLQELGKYLEPKIGKSGVNHRLKKLTVIADRMREQ